MHLSMLSCSGRRLLGLLGQAGLVAERPLTGDDFGVRVRLATVEDAPVVARLGAEVQDLHHRHRPDVFKAADRPAVSLYESRLADPAVTVYLAEDDTGAALGYVLVRVYTIPETPLMWGANVVDVDEIGVTNTRRRQGVGRELFKEVGRLAKTVSADRLHLTVWEFNESAQAFFRFQGLKVAMHRMTDP